MFGSHKGDATVLGSHKGDATVLLKLSYLLEPLEMQCEDGRRSGDQHLLQTVRVDLLLGAYAR